MRTSHLAVIPIFVVRALVALVFASLPGCSSSGGGSGDAGVSTVNCFPTGSYGDCTITETSDPSDQEAQCVKGGGVVVSQCPSSGVEGCCFEQGGGACYYSEPGETLTVLMQVCTGQGHGTWTTTPP
jgi:hypothetical protein